MLAAGEQYVPELRDMSPADQRMHLLLTVPIFIAAKEAGIEETRRQQRELRAKEDAYMRPFEEKWRKENPQTAGVLMGDMSVRQMPENTDPEMLRQLNQNNLPEERSNTPAVSTPMPRRYGEPGKNLGEQLYPQTGAVPAREQTLEDVRREVLAHANAMNQSRAIMLTGIYFAIPGPEHFAFLAGGRIWGAAKGGEGLLRFGDDLAVAPSRGAVSETTGAVTNLGTRTVAENAELFAKLRNGEGMSGVYDHVTRKFVLRPSEHVPVGPLRQGHVQQYQGHASVRADLGKAIGQDLSRGLLGNGRLSGFSLSKNADGVTFGWNSRTINEASHHRTTGDRHVPEHLRSEIERAVRNALGL